MKRVSIIIAATMSLVGTAQSIYPGTADSLLRLPSETDVVARAFPLSDVRLLPGRLHKALEGDSAWMSAISVDRLVHSFRNNAGVFAGREGGYESVPKYGGWESLDCDLRGHTTGHFMSACGLMYASTGDEQFRLKGDSIVNALAEVQQALGGGYLSAFPEELINRNMQGKAVWAPWYTLHKILSGLIDQYVYCGNTKALDVATRMADWAYNKLAGVGEEQRALMLRNEFGGINDSFYNLYALTAEPRYLELARFFYHNDVIDPLRNGNTDFGTRHTNTFIPKIIAEARNYELTGDTTSRHIADLFWHQMTGYHCFATGSLSQKEHFFDPEHKEKYINGYTGETCCTYNMLKLSRHLFCWEPSAEIADYYERALFNHILAQQDPESHMVCYFLPLLSGSYKVYSTPEHSFWCCVGSGFESHAKYAESIYYHSPERLWVNLMAPSTLKWREQGIELTQRTAFPASGDTEIVIDTAEGHAATISLRYPGWSRNAVVKINGREVKINADPGSYIDLRRRWRKGDRITASFPMELHMEYADSACSRGAVLYGPIVLAGDMGTDGMDAPAPFSDPTVRNDYYTYDYHVPENLNTTLRLEGDIPSLTPSESDALVFVDGDGHVFRPLFDLHRRRYVVYWDIEK